ncbi:MAG: hypothetical protein V5A88_09035 [Candidatus Thermoplasmatota archaeon]
MNRRLKTIAAVVLVTFILMMSVTLVAKNRTEALKEEYTRGGIIATGAVAGAGVGAAAFDGPGAVVGAIGGAVVGMYLASQHLKQKDVEAEAHDHYINITVNEYENRTKMIQVQIQNADTDLDMIVPFNIAKAEYAAKQLYEWQDANDLDRNYSQPYIFRNMEPEQFIAQQWRMANIISGQINDYANVGDVVADADQENEDVDFSDMEGHMKLKAGSDSWKVVSDTKGRDWNCTTMPVIISPQRYDYSGIDNSTDRKRAYLTDHSMVITNGLFAESGDDGERSYDDLNFLRTENREPAEFRYRSYLNEEEWTKTKNLETIDPAKLPIEVRLDEVDEFYLPWADIAGYGMNSKRDNWVYDATTEVEDNPMSAGVDEPMYIFMQSPKDSDNYNHDFSYYTRETTSGMEHHVNYKDLSGLNHKEVTGDFEDLKFEIDSDHAYGSTSVNRFTDAWNEHLSSIQQNWETASMMSAVAYEELRNGTTSPEAFVPPSIIFPDPERLKDMSMREVQMIYRAYMAALNRTMDDDYEAHPDDVPISPQSLNLRLNGYVVNQTGASVYGSKSNPKIFSPFVTLDDTLLENGTMNTWNQTGFSIGMGDPVRNSSIKFNTETNSTWPDTEYVNMQKGYGIYINYMTYNGEEVQKITLNTTDVDNYTAPATGGAQPPWTGISSEDAVSYMIPILITSIGLILWLIPTDRRLRNIGQLTFVIGAAWLAYIFISTTIDDWSFWLVRARMIVSELYEGGTL